MTDNPTLQSEKLEPCEPSISDAINEVERLYDEWWDIDRRRWLNVVLERLRARKDLGSRAPVVAPQRDAVTKIEVMRDEWQRRADAAPIGTYENERFPLLTCVRAADEILTALKSPASSPVPPEQFRNEEGEQQATCANCAKPIIKGRDYWYHKYGWMKECHSDRIVATPAATPTPADTDDTNYSVGTCPTCKQPALQADHWKESAVTFGPLTLSVREAAEAQLDAMWNALKQIACKVPADAKTIVFLGEEKFREAMAPFCSPVSAAGGDEECSWTLDDSNDGDFWETGCGEAFRFTDGGPTDNGFTFCYKCGKRISAGRYSDDAANVWGRFVMDMPAVGDRVRLTEDIWDDGCDNHHPPGYFARRGEILIVRNLDPGHEWPVLISHKQITDQSFRVGLNEIEPENPNEH